MAPLLFRTCSIAGETPQKCSVVTPSPSSDTAVDISRRIIEFELHTKIGKGGFGTVFAAKDKLNGAVVAVKKIKRCRNGRLSRWAEDEIRHLSECCAHPFVVDLKAVVYERFSVFLVMENADMDLGALIRTYVVRKDYISDSLAKYFMKQILSAVAFLHSKDLIHGDVKPANILVVGGGEHVKLCDFGTCHKLNNVSRRKMMMKNARVFGTLWYRAPELLMGATEYSTEIDVWSMGCTMAEMLLGRPIFPGTSDADTLVHVFNKLGIPSERSWPEFLKLPLEELDEISHGAARSNMSGGVLEKLFGNGDHHRVSMEGIDLLNKLLTFNPAERITASAALKHKWFEC